MSNIQKKTIVKENNNQLNKNDNIFNESKEISLQEGQKILEGINSEIEENNNILNQLIEEHKKNINDLKKNIEQEKDIGSKNENAYNNILEDIKLFEGKIIDAESNLKEIKDKIEDENENQQYIKQINELKKNLEDIKLKNQKDLNKYKGNIENFFFLRKKG